MIKLRNSLIVLGGIFFIFWISGWIGQKSMQSKYASAFKSKINDEIKFTACIKEGPFPFSSRIGRQSANSSYVSYTCDKCDILHQAGLLSKEVLEYTPDPAMGEYKKSGYDTRYELTELGNSMYIPGSTEGPYGKDPSRFCLGKARVHEITRTIGPVMLGGVQNIGIRYVAELENPHPFLHDPLAKLLGIPLPQGNPPRYPEANVTAVFYNKKDFELDGSLKLGM